MKQQRLSFLNLPVWLKAMVGLVLIGLSLFSAAYMYPKIPFTVQRKTEKLLPLASKWEEYVLPDASFRYPPSWEVLEKIPTEYLAKSWGEEGWSESKMFIRECSGPILRNTATPSTIVAVEIREPEYADGDFCWSRGDAVDRYSRQVSLNPTEEISVMRWWIGSAPVETSWQGDIVQFYSFNVNRMYPDKNRYVFALVYQDGEDDLAETTFDQILATFQYSD